jgi:hypothetical protein
MLWEVLVSPRGRTGGGLRPGLALVELEDNLFFLLDPFLYLQVLMNLFEYPEAVPWNHVCQPHPFGYQFFGSLSSEPFVGPILADKPIHRLRSLSHE